MPPKESNLSRFTAVQFIIFFPPKLLQYHSEGIHCLSTSQSLGVQVLLTCQCIKMPKLQMAVLERSSYVNDLFSTSLDWDVVLFKGILGLLINASVTLFKRWTCQCTSGERKKSYASQHHANKSKNLQLCYCNLHLLQHTN